MITDLNQLIFSEYKLSDLNHDLNRDLNQMICIPKKSVDLNHDLNQ